jgi:hypothetical protein
LAYFAQQGDQTGTGEKAGEGCWAMSNFARGVVGVFGVGLIAGIGALMLIPQSSPRATARAPDPPAHVCGQPVVSGGEQNCQKPATVRREPNSIAALRRELAAQAAGEAIRPEDMPTPTEALPTPAPEAAAAAGASATAASTAAPTRRSADNVRAAQRRKADGLSVVRRFGDDMGDLRASAYAPEGARRGARQRGSRNPGAGFAMGNGFFPFFR